MYYPSGLFRLKARKALKGHWQTALLVALVVNLPTLLMQGISAFTGNDAFGRLQNLVIAASRDGQLTNALLQNEVNLILNSTSFWLIRGGDVVAWLVTPCLSLGLYKWLMDLLQGQEGPVSTVFCRVRYFFKALGLQLLIILKVLLWMLPGIALAVVSMVPLFNAATSREQLAMLSTLNGLTPLAVAAMAVPGIMAALRYALADYIQADKPETKVTECVRQSIRMMNGQKKTLFSMMLMFLLLYLAQLLLASFLAGMGSVVSLVFQMLAVLALNVYMSASVAAFYRQLAYGKPEEVLQAEELN